MRSVLGIDLGTQHLKVLCYDFEARRVLAVSSSPLALDLREGGVAEQRAGAWLEALRSAVGQVDPAVRRSVVAIGVAGQQHGFVPLDRADHVLAPVKLWCDTSTHEDCAAIVAELGGPAACLEAAGNVVLPGYTASKVRAFRRHRREFYDRLCTILLPHDYINLHLTGERCMEAGDASGTGFLDVRHRVWSDAVLRAIDPGRDLRDCLPRLRFANEPIGSLRAVAAGELGLPAGLPVSIGGGDNMMAAIATGNISAGTLTMSLGTSGTVFAHAAAPVIDPSGNIAAFCSSTGGWLPLLCTMNCTVSTELARGLFGMSLQEFAAAVSAAPRGSGGVLTLPFFAGERTPNLPAGKGCIVGLDPGNARRENLLRSAVEGATFALRFGIDELARLGIAGRTIVLTGGGSRSATWRQIVADVCGLAVRVPEHEEGAAFGAALQALALIDPAARGDVAGLVREHVRFDAGRGCEPDEACVAAYAEDYQRYRRALQAVTTLYA